MTTMAVTWGLPMSRHLLFCSDLARRDVSPDRITRIEGWCIGSSPVHALLLKIGEGEFETIPYGFSRTDVRGDFAAYPNAEKSGFRFSGDFHAPPKVPVELWVQLRPEPASPPEWHMVRVDLDTHDIQTLELDEETRLTGASEDAAVREVISADNIETRFGRTLRAKGGLTLRLDIINKCNLRCVMCHFSDDAVFKRPTRQLTGEQFKNLFDGIGADVSRVALSCGDEPLISKFLPEILRYLAMEHPHVAIEFCTNAMLMHAPIRNVIMETGVARVSLSMDAVTKPLLEAIRVGCRYEQLVGNIMALRDLKAHYGSEFPAFVFNFVMMNQNIHEAPAFVRLAQALGAESIDFRHMVPIGTWFPHGELLSDHPAKYNYYRQRIAAEAAALDVNYYLPEAFDTAEQWLPENEPEVSFSDFNAVVPDAPGPGGMQIKMRSPGALADLAGTVAEEFSTTFCERPFSEIMIRDQDEVLPCPWHGKTLGRLSEGKSLSEIFLGENFAALRRNMLKPEGDPDCARCPIKTLHLPVTSNS
jgi:molybdenum cofactor biosynthesis enzyme MoaA